MKAIASPLAVLTWNFPGVRLSPRAAIVCEVGHAWNDLKSGGLLYSAHSNERDDADFASVADAAEAFLFVVSRLEPGQFGHSAVFEFPDY